MKPERITAIRDGKRVPLFDGEPLGLHSPSPTLLIETHEVPSDMPLSHVITEQIATLFLDAAHIDHCSDSLPPERLVVPAGAVALSLRDEMETVRWVRPARVVSVRIDDRVLAEASLAAGRSGRATVMPASSVQSAQLTMLMGALHAEQRDGFRSGRLFLDGIEQAMAATLVGHHASCAASESGGGLTPAQARRVDDLVRSRLDGTVAMAELADCAGYSVSHFTALFRQTFGTTPHRYVTRLRIERAMTLLAKPHWSVPDVAIDCGFQTTQHFARVFRAVTGVSPGEFRRRG
ncbi:AraC family transcriptional regulator [Pandoraea capi]|uniref:AraC family transcriptional regulator n=1 Tax=Pandoraea capi TaxID=2508286 RepID=A0ABY6WCA9_9BURK|nr:helix-turn-helix transcriptional regulator [Pandoraea capi]VVE48642.1 AraC family transcriptional regulator [Pandoraea capi]